MGLLVRDNTNRKLSLSLRFGLENLIQQISDLNVFTQVCEANLARLVIDSQYLYYSNYKFPNFNNLVRVIIIFSLVDKFCFELFSKLTKVLSESMSTLPEANRACVNAFLQLNLSMIDQDIDLSKFEIKKPNSTRLDFEQFNYRFFDKPNSTKSKISIGQL